VLTITLHNKRQIAQEFFRWEVATAVAGAFLGIDPFDQPDVESTKIEHPQADRSLRTDRHTASTGSVCRIWGL
jgi:glucose-6-phosphate isomerase